MQPVYEAVEALILELTRFQKMIDILMSFLGLCCRLILSSWFNHRSEGGCLPGEWSESSYKLAIRAATLIRVCHILLQVLAEPSEIHNFRCLQGLVEEDDWETAEQLIKKVQAACVRLEEALPHLHVVPNVIKRILKLIREEYFSAVKNDEVAECGPESLQKMLKSGDASVSDYKKQVADLKERVFEIIDELLMELDSASEEISKQALEHIHANEIVLTIGRSRTVERFLKFAAKTRKFSVIVAEAGPVFSGQAMAASLAAARIPTTLITDSAIFAMMARVNKVTENPIPKQKHFKGDHWHLLHLG